MLNQSKGVSSSKKQQNESDVEEIYFTKKNKSPLKINKFEMQIYENNQKESLDFKCLPYQSQVEQKTSNEVVNIESFESSYNPLKEIEESKRQEIYTPAVDKSSCQSNSNKAQQHTKFSVTEDYSLEKIIESNKSMDKKDKPKEDDQIEEEKGLTHSIIICKDDEIIPYREQNRSPDSFAFGNQEEQAAIVKNQKIKEKSKAKNVQINLEKIMMMQKMLFLAQKCYNNFIWPSDSTAQTDQKEEFEHINCSRIQDVINCCEEWWNIVREPTVAD